MRTPFSELFHKGLIGSLDVEKAGTSEGADRGWETRRGRAPAERTPGEGRERAAEETPTGVPTGVSAPKTGRPAMRSVLDNANTVRAADQDNSLVSNLSMLGGDDHVGKVYIAEFADGTKAIYKPSFESGLAAGTMLGPIRHSLDETIPESARERAAFLISDAMGMAIVPHVERVNFARSPETRNLRRRELENSLENKLEILALEEKKSDRDRDEFYADELRFEIEELGEWIEQAADDEAMGVGHTMAYVTGEDVENIDFAVFDGDIMAGHPDLHRVAALDIITGNTDRHTANLRRGDDGRYYAIDNGLAFPIDSDHDEMRADITNTLGGFEIPQAVQDEIFSFEEGQLHEIMSAAGFNREDIMGARARLAALKGAEIWPTSKVGKGNTTSRLLDMADTELAMMQVEEL